MPRRIGQCFLRAGQSSKVGDKKKLERGVDEHDDRMKYDGDDDGHRWS